MLMRYKLRHSSHSACPSSNRLLFNHWPWYQPSLYYEKQAEATKRQPKIANLIMLQQQLDKLPEIVDLHLCTESALSDPTNGHSQYNNDSVREQGKKLCIYHLELLLVHNRIRKNTQKCQFRQHEKGYHCGRTFQHLNWIKTIVNLFITITTASSKAIKRLLICLIWRTVYLT